MKNKPKLLDAFCCAGGAGKGYSNAGFDVTGIDIEPQPNYPHKFIQGDALEYIDKHGHEYDAVHASPPCQAYTKAQRIRKNEHPDLIAPTRELLVGLGAPWVIENVPDSPLINPRELCGAMFNLLTYRHRLFETSFDWAPPAHPAHVTPNVKMGRRPREGQFIHVVGNFSGVEYARRAMGIDWMTRDELRESIPPAYTEYIGKYLIKEIK